MPDISNDRFRTDVDTDAEEPAVDETAAEDTGRTSGGGSLGHDQPDDVKRETPIRNATRSDRDPVMPGDDATLKTKI